MSAFIGTLLDGLGDVQVKTASGETKMLSSGDNITEGDILQTGDNSKAVIKFNNGCKMELGAKESALVDETVYQLEFFEDNEILLDDEAVSLLAESSEDEEDVESDENVEEDIDIESLQDFSELEDTAAGEELEESTVDDSETIPDVEEDEVDIEEVSTLAEGFEENSRDFREMSDHSYDKRAQKSFMRDVKSEESDQDEIAVDKETFTPEIHFLDTDFGEDGITNSTPSFSAQVEVDSHVNVYDHGVLIDSFNIEQQKVANSVTIEGEGEGEENFQTFYYAFENLSDGLHDVTVEIISPDNQNTFLSEPLVFTLDTTVPELSVESIDLTNSDSPALEGRVDDAQAKVSVAIGETSYNATNHGDGSWSVDAGIIEPLVEGENSVTVLVEDTAGNQARSNGSITLDSTAPDAPIIELMNNSGENGTFVTSDGILNITPNEEGSTLEYSYDDGTNWSLNTQEPSEGENSVSVREIDSAGNISVASKFNFTLDTSTAPDAPTIELLNDSGEGTDFITNDATLTITPNEASSSLEYSYDGGENWSSYTQEAQEGENSVSVREIDSAGNVSVASSVSFTLDTSAPELSVESIDLTNSDRPAVEGSVDDANATVIVSIGENSYNATNHGDGSWSVTSGIIEPLGEGENSLSVLVHDIAGNQNSTTGTITLDSTAPDAPTIELLNDSGEGADFITNDATLTITPNEASSSLEYSYDGGENWSSYTQEAQEGENSVSVREIDSAGNVSVASSVSFTLDTSAPEVPTISPLGIYEPGNITISGSAEGESEVSLYSDDTLLGAAMVNGAGEWSILLMNVEEATYNLQVSTKDIAGNSSELSGINELIVVEPVINEAPVVTDISLDVIDGELEFNLSSVVSDTEDELYDDTTLIRVDSLPHLGLLFNADGEEISVGDTFVKTEMLHYEVGEDAGNTILVGTKTDSGTQSDWGESEDGIFHYTDVYNTEVTISGAKHGHDRDVKFEWDNLESDKGVGIGVKGGDHGQIDLHESIIVDFSTVMNHAEIGLAGLGTHFDEEHKADAHAEWKAYLDGELVDSGDTQRDFSDSDGDANINTISLEIDTSFDQLIFTTEANRQSNFSIKYIETQYGEEQSVFEFSAIDSDGVVSQVSAEATLNFSTSAGESENSDIEIDSPLSDFGDDFDFDHLDDLEEVEISDHDHELNNLNYESFLDLSSGERQLLVVSEDSDEETSMILDSNVWQRGVDSEGNHLIFEGDDGAYDVFMSVDASNELQLFVDQNISILLENEM
jgi:hypothetical protein